MSRSLFIICLALVAQLAVGAAVPQQLLPRPATVDEHRQRVRYDNCPLYEATPTTDEHLRLLERIGLDEDIIVLNSQPRLNRPWTFIVAAHKHAEFDELLDAARIDRKLIHDNVQLAIDAESSQIARSSAFGWTSYQTLSAIEAWMDELVVEHGADRVQLIDVGRTYENRTIRGVRLSTSNATKPGVFIEGGIHAREWVSTAFVTYLINELLTSESADVRRVAEAYNWFLVPSVNPDGYEFSHTTDRLWRKTRSPQSDRCRGADPNRNWDIHWAEVLSSTNPCHDAYPGTAPFSEIEMRTLADFLHAHAGELDVYVSFHAYSQLLMFPHGFTKQPAHNAADLQSIGDAAAEALFARHGKTYTVGSIYETIYPASGSSLDYVHQRLNISLSYTYELRPSLWSEGGFELPAEQIVAVGEETVDSLVALLGRAEELGYGSSQPKTTAE